MIVPNLVSGCKMQRQPRAAVAFGTLQVFTIHPKIVTVSGTLPPPKKIPPPFFWKDGGNNLAATYSHTACRRTTIGATAFHFR
ncbi:MAG: hypothetical protein KGS60_10615, partial [Verrucomicrobia bacterium]|nr:hypothetical protein [Verrucomicrobiota bacterium]